MWHFPEKEVRRWQKEEEDRVVIYLVKPFSLLLEESAGADIAQQLMLSALAPFRHVSLTVLKLLGVEERTLDGLDSWGQTCGVAESHACLRNSARRRDEVGDVTHHYSR